MPTSVWLRPLAVVIAALALYLAGYGDGSRTAQRAADKEKAEIIGIYQGAALMAEQQYAQKLVEAAAEKQKWFDFAQRQSEQLAEASRLIDSQAERLQEQIPDVVKQDGNHFNGLGADSLRHYKRSLGYAD